MPPKESATSAAESSGPKLTDSEVRVLSLAWQCFKTMPQVSHLMLSRLLSPHMN